MPRGRPFYAGVFRWKGRIYPGNHQPMISLAQFEQAQEILSRTGKARAKKTDFAFNAQVHHRILRCGRGEI